MNSFQTASPFAASPFYHKRGGLSPPRPGYFLIFSSLSRRLSALRFILNEPGDFVVHGFLAGFAEMNVNLVVGGADTPVNPPGARLVLRGCLFGFCCCVHKSPFSIVVLSVGN